MRGGTLETFATYRQHQPGGLLDVGENEVTIVTKSIFFILLLVFVLPGCLHWQTTFLHQRKRQLPGPQNPNLPHTSVLLLT
jgi:hypothetical protein